MQESGRRVGPHAIAALDFLALGPLVVRRDGTPLDLGGPRQRAVLATLLFSRGSDVSVERLADAVWAARPPAAATATIQTYVFHLRRVLEPGRPPGSPPTVLLTVPGGYRLDVPADHVDTARFEALVGQGRAVLSHDPASARALLTAALALWRGELVSDLPELSGVPGEASRLAELRELALESRLDALIGLGEHELAVAELEGLTALHPLREHLHAARMLTLYRCGRQAEALAAYAGVRSLLRESLGVEPGPELRALHRQILRQDPALERGSRDGVDATVAPVPAGPGALTPRDVTTPPSSRRRGGVLRRRGGVLRRRRARGVTVGAVVAAIALAWSVAPGVLRAADPTPLPANSVGPLDEHGLVGEAVPLRTPPTSLVVAGGDIWVGQEADDAVSRIDPQTRRVVTTIPVGGSPGAMAAHGDDVWVAAAGDGVVVRIDVQTGRQARIPVGVNPGALAVGPDAVWVANTADNTVQRIDVATNTPGPALVVGDGPHGLALEGSTLWVANGRAGTVSQIDTATGSRRAADVRVDSGPSALAVTASDVWVTNELSQTVSRIARATLQVSRLPTGDGPSSVVLNDDAVWVSNRDGGTLTRVDPATNAVTTLTLRSSIGQLVVVDGVVWGAAGAYVNREHVGGTLVWTGVDKAHDTNDPAGAYQPETRALVRPVYDGLVTFRTANGQASQVLVPDLATRVPEPTDGGRTYVFTLRPGIRYSTGRLVTASDFVLGLRRALHTRSGNPGFFRSIVGAGPCIDAPDFPNLCRLGQGVVADDAAGTLTIRLERPDADFLAKLTYFVYPAPPGTPLSDLDAAPPPGTGPYLITRVGKDGSVTLTSNPLFRPWSFAAQPPGYPDTIVYRVAPSEQAALDDVVAGRAHGSWTYGKLPASISSRPSLLHVHDLWNTDFVYLNPSLPPFDHPDVRRALNYAVDRRQLMALTGSAGGGAVPTCQLLPPTFAGHRPYCPYQAGVASTSYAGPDLQRALELVDRSGTMGASVTVHSFVRYPLYARWAGYLAAVLTRLHYRVTVKNIPIGAFGDLVTRPWRHYQVFSGPGWYADYPSPANLYDQVVGCREATLTGYCNRAVEALAERARSLARTDPTASLLAWADVDRQLVDDAAFVAVENRRATTVVSPRVGNYLSRPVYGTYLDQLWIR